MYWMNLSTCSLSFQLNGPSVVWEEGVEGPGQVLLLIEELFPRAVLFTIATIATEIESIL